jgi:hypothetical protein
MPDHNAQTLEPFFSQLADAINANNWHKLLLSKYRGPETELQRLVVRPIQLRGETVLSFVYSYKTRDITKNHSAEEAIVLLQALLGTDFKSAHLQTNRAGYASGKECRTGYYAGICPSSTREHSTLSNC